MSVVAAAVIGSTVVGAVSSRNASKQQAKGVERGLDQSSALAQQARKDVMRLFESSAESGRIGSKAAFDFYKRVAPQRMLPYMQGNQAAQRVIGLGAEQANNAILGKPVDMSFTDQPQMQPNSDYLENVELPEYPSATEGVEEEMDYQGAVTGGGLISQAASNVPRRQSPGRTGTATRAGRGGLM